MSKADKIVSIKNYMDDIEKNGPLSILTLFTGVNKNLENYEETEKLKKEDKIYKRIKSSFIYTNIWQF